MKSWTFFLGLFYIGTLYQPLSAQTTTPPDANILEFKLLRQNDSIAITEPKDFYQRIKSSPLKSANSLSFGGSYRFQTEAFINEQFDKTKNQSDAWYLHRGMLHAHLKLGNNFEIFSELNSSTVLSKQNIAPVDKDILNINQLFARYYFNDHLNLLIGRQNMRYGIGRLIDVREGPNVRLSFDMAQLQYKNQISTVTGFYAIPVQQKEGVFDNEAFETDETLTALYWTQHWTAQTNTDLNILHKDEANKTWNAGTASDQRTSIGLRHFGTWNGLTYNNEFVYQLGTFGDENISAWTVSFNVEKEFNPSHPITLGLKTEAISGDADANDNTLNTFDALYPRGAYFGRVARFGPSNLIDVHPYVKSALGKVSIEMDYVAFWRFSTDDGLYNPALLLEYPSVNNERFIANQIGAIVGYEVNKFITFELESNVIFPGAFLKQSHQGDTLYHFVFTTEFKF
ncbi:alginate export protein [Gelidibacter sediminis]|uniref:Alginate export protein n=1 Tax=Gelidibacter sediminis TaxID=1608710 RepID=A0A4R7PLA1_9FLAO|nr:porin [Gelidibacter sediminis]TDU34330.1 alginate export protein [Gelidibacter sediminis]